MGWDAVQGPRALPSLFLDRLPCVARAHKRFALPHLATVFSDTMQTFYRRRKPLLTAATALPDTQLGKIWIGPAGLFLCRSQCTLLAFLSGVGWSRSAANPIRTPALKTFCPPRLVAEVASSVLKLRLYNRRVPW